MQKKKLFLSLFALCSIVGMGITSCNNEPVQGPQGEQGPAGENGENGEDGSLILTGEGKPEDTLGKDSDIYIDSKTGDLYQKENGTWTLVMNIKGEDGKDGEDGINGSSGSDGQDGETAWSNTILPSEGGYVSVNVGSATINEDVTFTVHPNESYLLDSLTIFNNNEEVTLPKGVVNSDGSISYTLDMAENGYVVLATFSTSETTGSSIYYKDGIRYENATIDGMGNIVNEGTANETAIKFDDGSGKEEDPLIVSTVEQALAIKDTSEDYFKFESSFVGENGLQTIPLSSSKNTVIDLNGNSIEIVKGDVLAYSNTTYLSSDESLTLKNGSITAKNSKDSVMSVIGIEEGSKGASVILEDVVFETNGTAVYTKESDTKITIRGSNISAGGYGVGTNASIGPDVTASIDIIDSTIEANDANGACGVMFNVDGNLNIENSTIYGTQQGVYVRLGSATIKNSTLNYSYYGNNKQDGTVQWGTGNDAPSAALVVGNNSATASYHAPSNVTLENVTFHEINKDTGEEVSESDRGLYYLYAYGYSEENDVTITMDETTATNVGDEYVYKNYVSVTTPSETYSSHESAFVDGQLYTSIWTKNEEIDTTRSTLVEGIKFTSGDGSVENPLVISSVEQLLLINKLSKYKFASTLNIKVDDSVTSLEVNESVLLSNDLAIEIDFNGKNVTLGKEAVFDLYNNSSLRVYGNPNFSLVLEGENANSLGYYFRLGDNSMITVEDGTYNFHMTVIQLDDSSKAYVNGGTYLDPVEYKNRFYTLNLIDGCDGKFYVRGGTFESYDPSNSESENPTANFLDEGYKTISRVVEEDGTTVTYYDVVIDE